MFLFLSLLDTKTNKEKKNYQLKSDHETARQRKLTKPYAVINKIILDCHLKMFSYDFLLVLVLYSVHGCCFTISFQNSHVLPS